MAPSHQGFHPWLFTAAPPGLNKQRTTHMSMLRSCAPQLPPVLHRTGAVADRHLDADDGHGLAGQSADGAAGENPNSPEGSPFWLTMIVFANQIPGLILGPFSGVVADRFRRRPILYLTQTLMMLQALVLAWLAYAGLIQVWHLLVLGAFLGVVSTFDVTTRQAFLTQMVGGQEDLANAIALNSSLFNGARLLGPLLAGALLGFGVTEGTCFLLNGVSYIAVLIGLWLMALARGQAHRPHARLVHAGGGRPLCVRLSAHPRHPPAGGDRQRRRLALFRAIADLRRPQPARRRADARPSVLRGRRRALAAALYMAARRPSGAWAASSPRGRWPSESG